jgi:microcystin-dependent protein
MSSPFVAEIRIFACNFAPKGWATCDGQLLPISQNTALFSLLGTFYGGDGKSTFALPNFDGSAGLNQGQSTTGTEYFLGQSSGVENVTLLQTEMPFHNHVLQASGQPGNRRPVAGNAMARSTGANMYLPSGTTALMAFQAVTQKGGSLPHNNMSPYLTLLYCIAMQGVFPPRG